MQPPPPHTRPAEQTQAAPRGLPSPFSTTGARRTLCHDAQLLAASAEKPADAESDDGALEDAARDEKDYLRRRLREELRREPTEEELNEWLRQHTEGY